MLLAGYGALTAASTSQSNAVTVLRFRQVWDGDRLLPNASVVIQGQRIIAVGTTVDVPKGAHEVDLRRLTALPGLIDLHTHVTYFWDRASGTTPLRPGKRRTPEETADVAAENAKRTLETGVTTIRDLGASGGADILMRDRVAAGTLVGPRMFVAGRGISAGRGAGPAPEAMRAEVDARVKGGSDWIKVYASRGSFDSVETTQTLTFEQLQAIVDAAHAAGRKVAIHSYGASGVKDAVRAGADSVEHGIELDDDTLAEMVKRRTVWVPTIDHNRYYVDAKDEYGFAAEAIAAAEGIHCQEPRINAARVQGRRSAGDGLRRRLHRVRTEHEGVGMVRQGRHDAGAGAPDRDDHGSRTAWPGGVARPDQARVLR